MIETLGLGPALAVAVLAVVAPPRTCRPDARLDGCRRLALRAVARPIPARRLTMTDVDVNRDIPVTCPSVAAR
jgi:hypothetical protein